MGSDIFFHSIWRRHASSSAYLTDYWSIQLVLVRFCRIQEGGKSSLWAALRNPTFLKDNAIPHVVGIVRSFLDTENVRRLTWPTHSPHLSPIGNVWSMVDEQLARHYTPVTAFNEM
ncbi:hypothetical protein TNCV_111571 [Trichonephila clavipes]|nr:hypothetical protein TNCV_111571 [Trichonephila clavipes]